MTCCTVPDEIQAEYQGDFLDKLAQERQENSCRADPSRHPNAGINSSLISCSISAAPEIVAIYLFMHSKKSQPALVINTSPFCQYMAHHDKEARFGKQRHYFWFFPHSLQILCPSPRTQWDFLCLLLTQHLPPVLLLQEN